MPMWQKEAMWIEFESKSKYALKVGIDKVNAITGKEWKSKYLSTTIEKQNYVAIPKQPWLDGINCGNNYIRQFVAMPLNEGYSVGSQIKQMKFKKKHKKRFNKKHTIYTTKKTKKHIEKGVGGIQLEIFPAYDENVDISQNYPFLLLHSEYDKNKLFMTPEQCNVEIGDKIWFYSDKLTKSMHRNVLLTDFHKDLQLLFTIPQRGDIDAYVKWIEYSQNNNRDYVIICDKIHNLFCNFAVVDTKKVIDKILDKHDKNNMYLYDPFERESTHLCFDDILSGVIKSGDVLICQMKQFLILVKNLAGNTLKLMVQANESIQNVKNKLFKLDGIAVERQRIVFEGKQLENDKILKDYNITQQETLHLVIRLRGGCFIAGTKVLLSNNAKTEIENIVIGEKIITYNISQDKLQVNKVQHCLKAHVNELVTITLSNNMTITCTSTHPLYIENKKCWCSVQPVSSSPNMNKIEIGDKLINSKLKLI
eukprot:340736_1